MIPTTLTEAEIEPFLLNAVGEGRQNRFDAPDKRLLLRLMRKDHILPLVLSFLSANPKRPIDTDQSRAERLGYRMGQSALIYADTTPEIWSAFERRALKHNFSGALLAEMKAGYHTFGRSLPRIRRMLRERPS